MWALLLNRYVLGGLAIAALALFLYHAKENYDEARRAEGRAPIEAAVTRLKAEAAAKLSAKIKENEQREAADQARAVTSQKDYEYAIKKLVADRDRYRANGLRFQTNRSGFCGSGAGSEASTSAGTPENATAMAGVQDENRKIIQVILPDYISAELRKIADEADMLSVWAKSCFIYVNKNK